MFRFFCWSAQLPASRVLHLLSLSGVALANSGYGSSIVILEDLDSASVAAEATALATTPEISTPDTAASATSVVAALNIEKPNLKFAFIKLAECAPLVIAKDKTLFDAEGLNVTFSGKIWWEMQENEPRLKEPQPEHPITTASLKPIVDSYRQEGKNFSMGFVSPVSTHNYEVFTFGPATASLASVPRTRDKLAKSRGGCAWRMDETSLWRRWVLMASGRE